MNKFILGMIFGSFLAALVALITAERIVYYKHKAKEKALMSKHPTIGLYKKQKKNLIPPNEAKFIPESETFFQYPRKAEFESVPGIKTEEIYATCFRAYVINRKLTNPEAWKEYQKDHPDLLPHGDKQDFIKAKKAFSAAMDRQRKTLAKKN